jgi:hypothetical protein
VLQVGQRIGAAVGIAAVGSVFFARVAATRGRGFDTAYQHALLIALIFVVASLVLAVVDIVVDRRITAQHQQDEDRGNGSAAERPGDGVPGRLDGAHAA